MYLRKLLLISKLALVLFLCYVIVAVLLVPHNATEIFAPASADGTENAASVEMPCRARNVLEDSSVIVERSIFGTAEPPLGQNRSKPGSRRAGLLPSAGRELGLELVGTVCGNPAISRAIIKNTETKVLDLYRTGETVAGASIQSIENNAVILLHNGRRKILGLRTGEVGPPMTSLKRAKDTAEVVKAKPRLPAKPVRERPIAGRPAKIGCIEGILRKAVIEPYVVNGQVEGLRITGLENVGEAKALGLKNGDIIRLVNGQQLTSLQKAFQVFQKAKSQPAISLELSRGGDTKTLRFDLR